jgi:hypothetical protein
MPRIDDSQGPGSTTEMPAIPRADERQGLPAGSADYARPGADPLQDTGRFQAPQGYQNGATGQFPAAQNPAATGQFPAQQGYDNGSTGQFAAPQGYQNGSTGQFPAQQGYDSNSTGQFERPQQGGAEARRPAAPQRPQAQRPEPEALPPAGPGDGRTPLYDTLETNWFRQERQGEQGAAPAAPQAPQAAAPAPAPQRPAATAWRSSPNDDLVRQAERVRQPAAGGITTSGLPRRVPRANLVPGTAQQQQHQAGPQVSRAPDDVRGRLTNLRRGIAQGRQAGNGQTGSFPSPSHQQER